MDLKPKHFFLIFFFLLVICVLIFLSLKSSESVDDGIIVDEVVYVEEVYDDVNVNQYNSTDMFTLNFYESNIIHWMKIIIIVTIMGSILHATMIVMRD